MPLYRYACSSCDEQREEIASIDAPPPICCEAPMSKRMPKRVLGRVAGSEQQQAIAREDYRRCTFELRANESTPPPREASPLDIPAAAWSGPATSRAEIDSRWRDTTQAMATWQANSLTADGVPYETAKRTAEQHQQQVSAQAEAQYTTT